MKELGPQFGTASDIQILVTIMGIISQIAS